MADAALHCLRYLTLPYRLCPLIGPHNLEGKVATHLAVKHTKYLHSDTEKSLARKRRCYLTTVLYRSIVQVNCLTVNPTPHA